MVLSESSLSCAEAAASAGSSGCGGDGMVSDVFRLFGHLFSRDIPGFF